MGRRKTLVCPDDASVSDGVLILHSSWNGDIFTANNAYITFTGNVPFYIEFGAYMFDGRVEMSTDKNTWVTFYNGYSEEYSDYPHMESGEGKCIYVRGTGNTIFSNLGNWWCDWLAGFYFAQVDYDPEHPLTVECSGNIENLLDYQTVLTGEHPVMGEQCFYQTFYACDKLTKAPKLQSTMLSTGCYEEMFAYSAVTEAPELPALVCAERCYENMFKSCTDLVSPPLLPATSLAENCYAKMFDGCTSLESAPELPAVSLGAGCYYRMFAGCESLTEPPVIDATTLAGDGYDTGGCCEEMFAGSGVTSSPELLATVLTPVCYKSMFYECEDLTSAGGIMAINAIDYCDYSCESMFYGCTSLVTPPTLPIVEEVASGCFASMFEGCTSLATAPSLPAKTVGTCGYMNMFKGCVSLETPPVLPAGTLNDACYYGMFEGCTSLSSLPVLPATDIPGNSGDGAYERMFYGCSSIMLSTTKTGNYTKAYRIPDNGEAYGSGCRDMFTNTGGSFRGTPSIETTYYTSNNIVPEYIWWIADTYYLIYQHGVFGTSDSERAPASKTADGMAIGYYVGSFEVEGYPDEAWDGFVLISTTPANAQFSMGNYQPVENTHQYLGATWYSYFGMQSPQHGGGSYYNTDLNTYWFSVDTIPANGKLPDAEFQDMMSEADVRAK